jgi:hypothetical protein
MHEITKRRFGGAGQVLLHRNDGDPYVVFQPPAVGAGGGAIGGMFGYMGPAAAVANGLTVPGNAFLTSPTPAAMRPPVPSAAECAHGVVHSGSVTHRTNGDPAAGQIVDDLRQWAGKTATPAATAQVQNGGVSSVWRVGGSELGVGQVYTPLPIDAITGTPDIGAYVGTYPQAVAAAYAQMVAITCPGDITHANVEAMLEALMAGQPGEFVR